MDATIPLVAQFLELKEIINCSTVCSSWRKRILRHDLLWELMIKKDTDILNGEIQSGISTLSFEVYRHGRTGQEIETNMMLQRLSEKVYESTIVPRLAYRRIQRINKKINKNNLQARPYRWKHLSNFQKVVGIPMTTLVSPALLFLFLKRLSSFIINPLNTYVFVPIKGFIKNKSAIFRNRFRRIITSIGKLESNCRIRLRKLLELISRSVCVRIRTPIANRCRKVKTRIANFFSFINRKVKELCERFSKIIITPVGEKFRKIFSAIKTFIVNHVRDPLTKLYQKIKIKMVNWLDSVTKYTTKLFTSLKQKFYTNIVLPIKSFLIRCGDSVATKAAMVKLFIKLQIIERFYKNIVVPTKSSARRCGAAVATKAASAKLFIRIQIIDQFYKHIILPIKSSLIRCGDAATTKAAMVKLFIKIQIIERFYKNIVVPTKSSVRRCGAAVATKAANAKLFIRIRITDPIYRNLCRNAIAAKNKLKRIGQFIYLRGDPLISVEEAFKVHSYSLGKFGSILELQNYASYRQLETSGFNVLNTQRPYPIIIIDRSSSMGLWCPMAIKKFIPDSLKSLGYSSTDVVTLMTFDNNTEVYHLKIQELKSTNMSSRGGTEIATCISSLSNCIYDLRLDVDDIHVIVLSDGEVTDIEKAFLAVDAATPKINNVYSSCSIRSALSVIRLKTTPDATPDIRCLSCIGTLTTSKSQVVHTIDLNELFKNGKRGSDLLSAGGKLISDKLIESSITHYGSIKDRFHVVVHADGCSTSPNVLQDADEYVTGSTKMQLGTLKKMFLYCSECDLQNVQIGTVKIEVASHPTEEITSEALDSVLCTLESQLAYAAIVGRDCKSIQKFRESATVWLEQLSIILDAAHAKPQAPKMRDRVSNFVDALERRQKTSTHRLLQLANDDVVAKLSAGQQAEFIVSVKSSTATKRRLAKRAQTTDSDLDFGSACAAAIASCPLGHFLMGDNVSESDRLLAEDITRLQHFLEDAGYVPVTEILATLADDESVPYTVVCHRDYPDPWQFEVDSVDCSRRVTECPGQLGCPVSYPTVYEKLSAPNVTFTNTIKGTVGSLQASLGIRGQLARIPNDIEAREAAILLHLITQQYYSQKVSSEDVKVVVDCLIYRLQKHCKHLLSNVRSMLEDDPFNCLIGSNDISSVLKPCSAIITSQTIFTEELLNDMLHGIYKLKSYLSAKRQYRNDESKRSTAINHLFDIDVSELCPELDFEKETDDVLEERCLPIIKKNITTERLAESLDSNEFSWVPDVFQFNNIKRFIIERGLCSDCDQSNAFIPNNMSRVVFRSAVACQSIQSPNEKSRLQSTCFDSDDCAMTYMRNTAIDKIRVVYEKRMSLLMAQEASENSKKLINTMIDLTCINRFSKLLTTWVGDRSNIYYGNILDKVLDSSIQVPLRDEKLYLCFTGQLLGDSTPVWSRGNMSNPHKYKSSIQSFSSSLWNDILAAYVVFLKSGHTYRDNGVNRHGHSNEKKSFFALGYPSLEAMHDTDPEAYAEYAKVHTNCCGFRSGKKLRTT